MKKGIFTGYEISFLISVSIAMALRQLAMIIVMPFLSVYGKTLVNSSSVLLGVALGIYGLIQGIMQIPFGRLSDKIGRKNVINIGTIFLGSGLILASLSKSVEMLIFARALQGVGAVAAVCFSWIGDNIEASRRARAMSIAGMFYGISSVLGFVGGPFLYNFISMSQIFVGCAILTFVSWFYILTFLKNDKPDKAALKEKFDYRSLLKNKVFLRITLSAFSVNYLLVSMFFIVPQQLERSIGAGSMWKVFIPASLLGVVAMSIASRFTDKGHFSKVAPIAFLAVMVGGVCMLFGEFHLTFIGTAFFMMGYTSLTTILSASVTKLSTKSVRGAVTGVFNTVQYLGSFAGGALTGFLWGIKPSLPSFSIILVCGLGVFLTMEVQDEKITVAEESLNV